MYDMQILVHRCRTAPEAMETAVFTVASDVWSYGVVLLELYTNAARPYEHIANLHLLDALKRGYRAGKPVHCPAAVYRIMRKCWAESSHQRPQFADIAAKLEDYKRVIMGIEPSSAAGACDVESGSDEGVSYIALANQPNQPNRSPPSGGLESDEQSRTEPASKQALYTQPPSTNPATSEVATTKDTLPR